MLIQAKGLSKIYGSGENQVVALDKADLTIAPGISSPLLAHPAAARAPCSICCPGWTTRPRGV